MDAAFALKTHRRFMQELWLIAGCEPAEHNIDEAFALKTQRRFVQDVWLIAGCEPT